MRSGLRIVENAAKRPLLRFMSIPFREVRSGEAFPIFKSGGSLRLITEHAPRSFCQGSDDREHPHAQSAPLRRALAGLHLSKQVTFRLRADRSLIIRNSSGSLRTELDI